jgi:probable HAF family extracellular repeat protein
MGPCTICTKFCRSGLRRFIGAKIDFFTVAFTFVSARRPKHLIFILALMLMPKLLNAAEPSATSHYSVRCIGRISGLVDDSARKAPSIDDLRSLKINVALNAHGDVLVGLRLYHAGKWGLLRIRHPKWLDGYAESSTFTVGMNDAGDVIAVDTAVSDGAWLTTDSRALLLRQGTQTQLPMVDTALAINNSHQILVSSTSQHTDSDLNTTRFSLFDLHSHQFTDLGEEPALALNDCGDVVVGSSLVRRRKGKQLSEKIPAALEVTGLNNRDVILGTLCSYKPVNDPSYPNEFTATVCHAVLWANGKTTILPALSGVNSMPEDLNDAGQVVGAAQINTQKTAADPIQTHAFLYERGCTIDVNALIPGARRIVLTDALRINRSGQILAMDDSCLYLLTPLTQK